MLLKRLFVSKLLIALITFELFGNVMAFVAFASSFPLVLDHVGLPRKVHAAPVTNKRPEAHVNFSVMREKLEPFGAIPATNVALVPVLTVADPHVLLKIVAIHD